MQFFFASYVQRAHMLVVLIALLLWGLSAYLVYSAINTKPPKGSKAPNSDGDGAPAAAVSGK